MSTASFLVRLIGKQRGSSIASKVVNALDSNPKLSPSHKKFAIDSFFKGLEGKSNQSVNKIANCSGSIQSLGKNIPNLPDGVYLDDVAQISKLLAESSFCLPNTYANFITSRNLQIQKALFNYRKNLGVTLTPKSKTINEYATADAGGTILKDLTKGINTYI